MIVVKYCRKYFFAFKYAFLFRHDLSRCYTFFFKANIQQYKEFFVNSQYECDEKYDKDIERVYYDIITKNDLKSLVLSLTLY